MKLLLAALFSFLSLFVMAQSTITVSGTVKSKDLNQPVVGATISMGKDETGIAVTDAKGEFTVTVPSKTTLIISYTGYEKQRINVNGRTSMAVVLVPKVGSMEQAVVQGFQKRHKQCLSLIMKANLAWTA